MVALLRGLLYLTLVPLWQAPDEPGHYEYAWLIGHEGLARAWLHPDQIGQAAQEAIEQQIIASLDRADFWTRTRQSRPNPLPASFDQNGFLARSGSQIGKSPLFYLIPALITRFNRLTLEQQAYALRAYSLGLWLMTVYAAWLGAGWIFTSRIARAALTAFFALAPMPTFIGVSINSDALANLSALASYVALAAILPGKPGKRSQEPAQTALLRYAGVLIVLVIALAIKRTNWFLLPTALVAAWLLVLRQSATFQRTVAWIGLLALAGLGVVVAILLFWRGPYADGWWLTEPLRPASRSTIAHTGHYALDLHDDSPTARILLTQALDEADIAHLRGHTVTASAWLRTARSTEYTCLGVFDGFQKTTTCLEATEHWQPLTVQHAVSTQADRLRIALGLGDPGDNQATGEILVDDVSVAGPDARNLLVNGSAETGRRVYQDFLNGLGEVAGPLDTLLKNLANPASYTPERWQAYELYVELTFAGFWGNFGWLQLPLPVPVYALLALVCLLAAAGLLRASRRSTRLVSPHGIMGAVMAPSFAFLALQTFLPMIAPASDPIHWQPQGRYLFPALFPLIVFLWVGLAAWLPYHARRRMLIGWCSGLVVLDLLTVITVIWPAYH